MANYRKVYKSDHLGVVDLEEMLENGQSLKLTIKNVKQEIGATVAGNKGNFNIAYFVEPIKPWVLNAGNAGIIKGFAKSIVKSIQPQVTTKTVFTENNFEKAKTHKATIEQIKNAYELTPEMETKYLSYAKN